MVVTLSLTLGLLLLRSSDRSTTLVDNISQVYEQTQARNLARAGIENAMMQLTTNSSLRGQLPAMALGGTGAGSVTVRIDSVAADTITLTAKGYYSSSPEQTVTVAATRQGINLWNNRCNGSLTKLNGAGENHRCRLID